MDAEKYQVEDDERWGRATAKAALENYVYSISNTINDKKISATLATAGMEKIEAAIDQVIRLLDDIQFAEAVEFENKLSELELICNPIITNALW